MPRNIEHNTENAGKCGQIHKFRDNVEVNGWDMRRKCGPRIPPPPRCVCAPCLGGTSTAFEVGSAEAVADLGSTTTSIVKLLMGTLGNFMRKLHSIVWNHFGMAMNSDDGAYDK